MRLLRFSLLFALAMGSAHAADMTSYFPARDVPRFLAANFDLASVRGSFGSRRTAAQRTFASLGQAPTRVTAELVEFDSEDWYYSLRILWRGDLNRDGIEDLEVCFVDRAKNGSYNSQQALLVSRYSDSGLALALRFEVSGCETVTR